MGASKHLPILGGAFLHEIAFDVEPSPQQPEPASVKYLDGVKARPNQGANAGRGS